MSWHFSRALVEEYSEVCSWDGALYAPSSLTPMPEAFCWPDRTMEPSRHSRFGMTSEPLTAALGWELLMWFLGASRARDSAAPPAVVLSTRTCGPKCAASCERCSRIAYLSRTSHTPEARLKSPPETYKPSDTACVAHFALEPTRSERPISATAFGLLATPTATGNQLAPSMAKWPGCRNLQRLADATGLTLLELYEWLMGWPIGWTDLRPLEMARFREWRQQHGGH